MMKCLIIDDDATARLIVNQFCLNHSKLEVVEQFPNAIEAIKYLNVGSLSTFPDCRRLNDRFG